MKYNRLGQSALKASQICLGTMTWGHQNTEAEGHEQMDYAVEQGINFFDTAEMYAIPPSADTYGRTEEIIGSWFAKTGRRERIILATKIAGPGLRWIRDGGNLIDGENILKAVEASLKRLQTDYIDLFQLHWPNRPFYHFQRYWNYSPDFDPDAVRDNFLEVLQTLDELVKEGKIRETGLSNETAWGTMTWLQLAAQHGLPRMQTIQNEFSLLSRMSFGPDLQEIAAAENCGLLAWSPLARGIISGKYIDGARPEGRRLTITPSEERRDTPACNEAVKAYIKIAEKHGLDICQMALAFVNRQPFVTSNIIGATNMEQLKSNIDSVNLNLSDQVLADIDAVYRKFPVPF